MALIWTFLHLKRKYAIVSVVSVSSLLTLLVLLKPKAHQEPAVHGPPFDLGIPSQQSHCWNKTHLLISLGTWRNSSDLCLAYCTQVSLHYCGDVNWNNLSDFGVDEKFIRSAVPQVRKVYEFLNGCGDFESVH